MMPICEEKIHIDKKTLDNCLKGVRYPEDLQKIELFFALKYSLKNSMKTHS